jgi:hypothetical protein
LVPIASGKPVPHSDKNMDGVFLQEHLGDFGYRELPVQEGIVAARLRCKLQNARSVPAGTLWKTLDKLL